MAAAAAEATDGAAGGGRGPSESRRVRELKLDDIRRPLAGVRGTDPAKVAQLAESIAQHGLQVPIDVLEVNGRFYGFSGCHRFAAHERLGRHAIRCRVIKGTEETLRRHLM